MRHTLRIGLILVVLTVAALPALAADLPQTPLKGEHALQRHYPKIVLYSVSWCPHCKEAKEYLTTHNIPFINRDVELDPAAMTALTDKYKSQGVPVIVIGNDEKILKGFSEASFTKAIKEVQQKK